MGCVSCRNFLAVNPPNSGWKPSYEGDTYGILNVLREMRKTKLHQKGLCTLYPVRTEVLTNHFCGQWLDCAGPPRPSDSDTEFIHGSWAVQQNEYLQEQVKQLSKSNNFYSRKPL